MTPSDIATALQDARPDLDLELSEGPAGLTIIASRRGHVPAGSETAALFGLAAGYLGWSNHDGERGGGWEHLVALDADVDAWEAGEAISDGPAALARIATTIGQALPERLLLADPYARARSTL